MMTTSNFMVSYMRRRAYAKITLYLHVKDRVDGKLHFRNVTVPIDLFDMIYIEKHEEMLIETDKQYLPNDKKNTVYKAINIMKHKYKIKDNFKVRIVKNIPAQSGLGGGSADAACVIRMLDDMYSLNLDDQQLIDIAKQIDEDTPFCLFNRPMIVEGTGDILTPIELEEDLYYLLVKPSFGTSTKGFMKRFDSFEDETGFEAMINAIKSQDYNEIVANTHNDFQRIVTKKNGGMKKVVRTLKEGNLEGVCMSGSGTCVYGLTKDIEIARNYFETIVFMYPFVKYGRIGKCVNESFVLK